jgi:flagellar motor switch protein FliM
LSKFEALTEGDIIYFNKGEHARMYVNSVPVFDADVGANGSQMAVRIIKPLSPLK